MSKSDVIPSSMGTSKQHDSCAIVSGGLDSTVLVYHMLDQGYTPHMLSFNYGQRHAKELQYATRTAQRLGLRHDIVDLTGITHLISNSALTSVNEFPSRNPGTGKAWTREEFVNLSNTHPNPIEVPEGHYAEDTMKATVVPNRNMIMLSIAAGVAVNNRYRTIGIGVHGGDHFIYPDCRPRFIQGMNEIIPVANEGFHNFDGFIAPYDVTDSGAIWAPFLSSTKTNIAYRGLALGVPFDATWSCYKGGTYHCGKCGTCVERLEAIHDAVKAAYPDFDEDDIYDKLLELDQTTYEDDEYWQEAIASRS